MEESQVRSNVTVAVRVKAVDKVDGLPDEVCVHPHEKTPQSSIVLDGSRGMTTFNFDFVHWSLGEPIKCAGGGKPPPEATQETVYTDVGLPVVTNTLGGYNCSIFAYGQTGSGKTFTMMGPSKTAFRGLIPRISEALFAETASKPKTNGVAEASVVGRFEISHTFVVSYIEIYMERVQDLLSENLEESATTLKVREHPKNGPYVDGATLVRVSSFDQVKKLLELGNSNRMVAATSMNSQSSRSHAVFTIQYTKRKQDMETAAILDQTSKLNLIDLAGSENAGSAGTTGERLKEGGSINKSLLTLGMVIKALADKAGSKKGGGGKQAVVPYRDSVLTFLLRDSLGGNSKTTMLATIRPGLTYLEETLSTLRYADRAKSIVNVAVINEDPLTKKIRELQEHIEKLTKDLASSHEREQEKALQIQMMNEQLLHVLNGGLTSTMMAKNTADMSFISSDTLLPDSLLNATSTGFLVSSSSRPSSPDRSPATSPTISLLEGQEGGEGGGEQEEEGETALASPRAISPVIVSPDVVLRGISLRQAALTYLGSDRGGGSDDGFLSPPPPAVIEKEGHSSPREEEDTERSPPPLGKEGDQQPPAKESDKLSAEEEAAELATPHTDTSTALTELKSPLSLQPFSDRTVETGSQPNNRIEFLDLRIDIPAALEAIDGVKDRLACPVPPQSPFQAGAERLNGFLYKCGARSKTYKRRWFVIRGNRLLWYLKYRDEESIHGALPLNGCEVVEANEEATNGHPYVFVIKNLRLPEDRTYALQASSEEERTKWINAIQSASLIPDNPSLKDQQVQRILKSGCTIQ